MLKGRCRQRDAKGNQCKFRNENHQEYNRHQKSHLEGILECPQCHQVFSPFEHNRPKIDLERHLKAHSDENISFMRGKTKEQKEFQCNVINKENNKKCAFSFSVENLYIRHQRQHYEKYECKFCPKTFNAFQVQLPLRALKDHLVKNHKEDSVVEHCEKCDRVFKDEMHKTANTTFSAKDQLEIHQKYNCFNFKTQVNYNYFAFINVNETSEDRPLENILMVYPGYSSTTIFRLLDQLTRLHFNYLKKDDDLTKDKKLVFVYKQTLQKGGLCVTLLKNNFGENQKDAQTSEFTSKYF